jgi:hypothetical protein
MKTSRFPLLLIVAAAAIAMTTADATTVIPPSFDELVEQAQFIFEGTVTDVRSEWIGEGALRRIVSYVTFRVEEAIKSEPGASYTLRMFGGTVNGETMGVADAPLFKRGDRDILFVENNGSQFIPLVGIMHGRFRVLKDPVTHREIVTTNAGDAVTDVAALGKDHAHEHLDSPRFNMTATPENALGAAEFKGAIRAKLGIAHR